MGTQPERDWRTDLDAGCRQGFKNRAAEVVKAELQEGTSTRIHADKVSKDGTAGTELLRKKKGPESHRKKLAQLHPTRSGR